MPKSRYAPVPEPLARSGEVLLSPNQLALLQGLYDRPGALAPSTADFVRAAIPYAKVFRRHPCEWSLRKATRGLHWSWVKRERLGSRIAWQLSPRGTDILELRVLAAVRGYGRYDGLRELRALVTPVERTRTLEQRWRDAVSDISLCQLTAAADALVVAWERSWVSPGMLGMKKAHQARLLRTYVREFVLQHRHPPLGVHQVGPGLTLDFDRYRPRMLAPGARVLVEHFGASVLLTPRDTGVALRLRALSSDASHWVGDTLVCGAPEAESLLAAALG